ncbi:MAG: hypothetical protein ABJC10_14130 [Acidobacteriota bacterium]
MNYFNYFTEIEDAFIRRRAKHLMLSPMDWALIESWKEMNVPLHVALRGIEKAFDSWAAKPRKRSVKSLLYCQEEVEAQFAEWRDARLGADEGNAEDDESRGTDSEALPFSRSAILEHLKRGQSSLHVVGSARKKTNADDFTDTLERAAALLGAVTDDFAASASPDAQKLEQSLSGLERMISDAVRSVAGSEQIATIEGEVKDQLQPYRKHMEPAVYQQTFENLLLKRLREQFDIPRLSLFYL